MSKEIVQKIEVEKQWTWEDEKLMEAYPCKKDMDEFRRIGCHMGGFALCAKTV